MDELLKLQKELNDIRDRLKQGCEKEEKEFFREEIFKLCVEINNVQKGRNINK